MKNGKMAPELFDVKQNWTNWDGEKILYSVLKW